MIKNRVLSFMLRNAVRMLARSKPEPEPVTRIILTIWKKTLLCSDWAERIGVYDAVSVKAADGSSQFHPKDVESMVSEIASVGVPLHLWGFHYCLTPREAREEAQRAAEECVRHSAVAYHWNAEKQWAAGGSPAESAIEFATVFRGAAPGVELFANCFHSQASTTMLSHFDYFEPMCYGTRRRTISRHMDTRIGRRDLPDAKKAVMVGTGRLEVGRDDRSWGYLEGKGLNAGLIQLVLKHRPAWVNFFRAGRADGEDIMVAANNINPALSEQANRIREALDGAVV